NAKEIRTVRVQVYFTRIVVTVPVRIRPAVIHLLNRIEIEVLREGVARRVVETPVASFQHGFAGTKQIEGRAQPRRRGPPFVYLATLERPRRSKLPLLLGLRRDKCV